MLKLTTVDPAFDPEKPVIVNGWTFIPQSAVTKIRNSYIQQTKFADPEPASWFREFVRRLDGVIK